MCFQCQSREPNAAYDFHGLSGPAAAANRSGDTIGVGASLPTYSLDQVALQLTHGYWAATNSRDWRAFDLTGDDALTVNIEGLDAQGQAVALEALAQWTAASGLQFERTVGNADIAIDDENSGAYSVSFVSRNEITRSFVNIDSAWRSYGDYYHQTFIHEIGHALGLGHAGNYNGNARFSSDAHYANDSWKLSIMSYFSQRTNPNVDASFNFLATVQMADILAIQNLYGTPDNVHSGDTVYGDATNLTLKGMDLSGDWAVTIFDSAGNDTVDLGSRGHNQRLNLRAESWSDINGATANFAIARGAVIENAVTGNGNDTVTGNEADNYILAGSGNDDLTGASGNDTLITGTGSDTVSGGSGDDTIVVGAGNKQIAGGAGWDTLVLNTRRSETSVEGTPDALTLTASNSTLVATGIEMITFFDQTVSVSDLLGLPPVSDGPGIEDTDTRADGSGTEDTDTRTDESGTQSSDTEEVGIQRVDISALTAAEQLQLIYTGYYNRAGDPYGFDFWLVLLEENLDGYRDRDPGLNLERIATEFFNQKETRAIYNLDDDVTAIADLPSIFDFLNDVYWNLFEREPDADGVLFWSRALAIGDMPVGEVILEIIKGAQGDDVTTIENKVEAGLYWKNIAESVGADKVDPDPAAEDPNYDSATAALDGVTSDPESVAVSKTATNGYFTTITRAQHPNNDPTAQTAFNEVDEDGALDSGRVLETGAGPNWLFDDMSADIFVFTPRDDTPAAVTDLDHWDYNNLATFDYANTSKATNHVTMNRADTVLEDDGVQIIFQNSSICEDILII